MIEHVVTPAEAGRRLDALVRALGALSQRDARRLCELGAVAVDGVGAAAAARPRTGQRIAFGDEHAALSLRLGLPVAHADDDVLVLHKPPGLAVHGGPLVDDSVADRLARELPGCGLAQRLDRGASGLLLVGRSEAALRRLGAAMEQGAIERTYEAVVDGDADFDERTVDLPLLVTDEPRGDQPKTVVADDGQRSVSHVRVLARRRGATLVQVSLETGRTHQIRAHLLAIGHPIVGDPRYGRADANRRALDTFGIRRPLLHCARLRLPGPAGGGEVEVTVTAAREPDFARMFPPRPR